MTIDKLTIINLVDNSTMVFIWLINWLIISQPKHVVKTHEISHDAYWRITFFDDIDDLSNFVCHHGRDICQPEEAANAGCPTYTCCVFSLCLSFSRSRVFIYIYIFMYRYTVVTVVRTMNRPYDWSVMPWKSVLSRNECRVILNENRTQNRQSYHGFDRLWIQILPEKVLHPQIS